MLSEIENNKVLFYKVDFDISVGDEMMPYICDAIYQRFIVIAYRLLGNRTEDGKIFWEYFERTHK